MSLLFWGSTVVMLALAIGFAAYPFRSGDSVFNKPRILVALLFLVGSFGFYALLGSPDAMTAEPAGPRPEQHSSTTPQTSQSNRNYGSVASLIGGLRDRLRDEPDDSGGWLLLAKSYQHLGHHDDALAAYARAQSLGATDTKLEAALLGAKLAPQTVAATSGPALRGRVSLSPEAASRVQAEDTVFIFAKESPEHRMPVVALRKRVADLPFDFILTDKEMMVPESSLGNYAELVVTAKISRSGNASDNSQGLEAWSEPVSPADSGAIELLIDVLSRSGSNDDE